MKVDRALFFSLAAVFSGTVGAYSVSKGGDHNPARRAFFNQVSAVTLSTAAAWSGLAPLVARAEEADEWITSESGLKYKVTKEGTGGIPEAGQTVKAHYTGWLDGFDSDKKFDSSRDRGRPFTFRVGAGQVIRGWDESFSSMKVGERRQIILPPRLGYGDRGAGGIIPGGATLYFDVELLGIL
mmetsp:Transcript_6120/g.7920  ORF Transcript_6120/g.7920 Transcript_6120/m.7920 type:complete len:183 (+) Transcript_6120:125-673(+)|eukprot:CAMPEP_0198143292 /NCGR_PEP_ID=MMETSP1443-20131203/6270_1 /TAXON_ID=186043 /ORGANISM="Entomoneis sp., Strain CCMP2396" /LENGTH=182 /DNA_ID=CAMNT_0043806511 /DNA_START=99 /DNA_END=647 /DNA_ORIENTATION=-